VAKLRRVRRRVPPSPLDDALARVGDRWTLLIVAALLESPKRFNELQDELGGIAPNVLSARLKGLAEHALVVARPYSERPPRFVYELSESGRELAGALRLLADWGARSSGLAEPLRHVACGTALQARWWCPTCEAPVEDAGAGDELIHV
jgi:DNA-binding HxlR family transcriptional regulator